MTRLTQLRRISPVVIAGGALLAAGCGSSQNQTGTSGSSPQNGASQAFKFAQCMRLHGVPNFPDPKVSTHGGDTAIAMVVPKSIAAPAQLKAANNACHNILPEPSPSQIAQQQRQQMEGKLSFARCMRSRGITAFPDPTRQGQYTLSMVTAAGVDIHAPAVKAAAMACIPASQGTVSAADIQRATAQ